MADRIACPVCCGRGGWSRATGEAEYPPPVKDHAWVKCLYCKGEGRCAPFPEPSGYR